ncbi:hypothetical protein JTB14_028812 [Gonioctena quinquepunctata]|nr:hypothetical protein JTB14_028812 [Gonioctena quinquepunctata]
MESISPEQLYKYGEIIEQINNAFKKSEKLKKQLETENDKIVLFNLMKHRMNQKLSYTSVKIFSNLLSLLTLYEDELQTEIVELLRYQNCKFYLIEVYTAKALTQKLKEMDCVISISIKTKNRCLNKSVNMNNRLPLVEVIPVDENVVDCSIETHLIFPTESWMTLKLDTVNVNVSHHLQTSKKTDNRRNNEILQLSKRYNEYLDFKQFKEEMQLEYEIRCEINPSQFVEAILKNSYHNLGIEHFTGITNDDNNEFILKLSHGLGKHEIMYNKKNKIRIKSNVRDLQRLKNYFFEVFRDQSQIQSKLSGFTELKDNLPLSIRDVGDFYTDMRKCWLNLPI